MRQYVGNYYSEELNATYQIIEKEGQLSCSINIQSPIVLQMKAVDVFTMNIPEYEVQLTFEKDQGNVSGFSVNAGRVTNLHFVKK